MVRKNLLFFPAVMLSIALIGCAKQGADNGKNTVSEQKPIQIAAPVANAITDFSFDFFKALQTETPAGDNLFVSPLSLHIALGMLVNGATNTTKTEILKALKAEGVSLEDLNSSYKKLLDELPKADPKVKLALANAIWYKNDFPVEPAFLSAMKNHFNAQVTGLPFSPSDVAIINKWASDNTNAKITKVLERLDPDLVMLLMNALYFKGDWTTKFDSKKTLDDNFYLEKGGTSTVKMMNQTDTFHYASLADYDALQLPYGNGQFRATLLLPKNTQTIGSLMNNFSIEKWNVLQNSLHSTNVIVGLPKFKLEQKFKLNGTLQKMGMVQAFDPVKAELKGINKTAPLYVSFVQQDTYVAVDEVGTEAAAVTTVGVGLTSAGPGNTPSFICNRPFAFIISEATSNTILFMGRIMSPDTH